MRRPKLYLIIAAVSVCAAAAAGLLFVRLRKPALSPERQALVDQGQELYQRMCSVCHGVSGEGYKADQAPMLANPEFLATVSDSFLRKAIVNGRRGTTMSAWSKARGGPLKPAEVEAVIAYLRTWQKKPALKLEDKPATGDPKRAEPTFARECSKCHGARGTGGPNLNVGNPELLTSAGNGFLRHAIRHGRPGTLMPAFEGKLPAPAVEDLLSLLRSWERPAPPVVKPPPRQAPIPLGPVPLNPKGPEPVGFNAYPKGTSVEVVHAALAKGARLALLDARAPSDYMREHIAGALSVPFYDPSPYLSALPKNTWLVCYCSCPHAESGKLAADLVAKGFPKVTVLDEGLGFWRNKNYPVQTGDKP
ncbi:MAG TPA: c-type cytochrome [Polyangiaceae bacterium]|nr:c-type cytochrome [Polyangiaceae bacterium]